MSGSSPTTAAPNASGGIAPISLSGKLLLNATAPVQPDSSNKPKVNIFILIACM
jgi:hypothetical protein